MSELSLLKIDINHVNIITLKMSIYNRHAWILSELSMARGIGGRDGHELPLSVIRSPNSLPASLPLRPASHGSIILSQARERVKMSTSSLWEEAWVLLVELSFADCKIIV